MPSPAQPSAPLAAQVQGDGVAVVCLHSSTGSGSQWRHLAEALSPRWRVLAPDLYGHGGSPGWPAGAQETLHVDAAAAARLVDDAPAHLVGHAYGAAVALQMALHSPERVRSLTLYEPVTFGMLERRAPADPTLVEITEVADSVDALVAAGCLDDAARVFAGYWGGSGIWAALDASQQAALARRIGVVPRHFRALFAARWDAHMLARLRMPVLLLRGSATRAPARRVSEALARALPHAQCAVLPEVGHLGPMTHPQLVGHWMTAHIDPLLGRRFSAADVRQA
jgi:pimeloyl-ACP methyl ester carboxylesterase